MFGFWKIDSYLSGVLLVAGANAVALGGLFLTRRAFCRLDMLSHREVGGFLLSIVGTMYAVILGLMVVDAKERFQAGRQTTEAEANALADIVLLANRYPPARSEHIRELALAYACEVTMSEWPLLDDGEFAPQARTTALRLIDAVSGFEPVNAREQSIYESTLAAASNLWVHRRNRVMSAARGIPGLEWFVLITGGLIVVAFTYFFRVDSLRIQAAMTALVASVFALNLYLILMFGYPFSGDVKVGSEAFEVTQAIIRHCEDEQTGPTVSRTTPGGTVIDR